jgi:hypothetical protein
MVEEKAAATLMAWRRGHGQSDSDWVDLRQEWRG